MNTKQSIGFLFIGMLILTSCGSTQKTIGVTDVKIYYPQNTDTVFFQFLHGVKSRVDIEEVSRFSEAIVGKKEAAWISKPYGIALQQNKIYLTDIGQRAINILDLENKTFNTFKPFHKDISFLLTLAVDTNGDRYIVDTKAEKIIIFNSTGRYKSEFNFIKNSRAVRIRIAEDKLYIADLAGAKIHIYDKNTHKYLGVFADNYKSGEDGHITMPMDFTMDDEYMYIADAGAFQVKIYKLDGTFVHSFGEHGNGYGLFNRMKSIAVTKDRNILVLDSATQLVQALNFDGEPLLVFAKGFQIDEKKSFEGLMVPTQMVIDYDNLQQYEKYVDEKYELKYLVHVISQLGRYPFKTFGRIELRK